jgi:hypothetical protein
VVLSRIRLWYYMVVSLGRSISFWHAEGKERRGDGNRVRGCNRDTEAPESSWRKKARLAKDRQESRVCSWRDRRCRITSREVWLLLLAVLLGEMTHRKSTSTACEVLQRIYDTGRATEERKNERSGQRKQLQFYPSTLERKLLPWLFFSEGMPQMSRSSLNSRAIFTRLLSFGSLDLSILRQRGCRPWRNKARN